MSVLIKGMEMPKSCRACRLKMNCDDCEGFECVCLPLHTQIGHLDDLLTDKRRDDCPLVPVPPHGRLIDADAVIDLVMQYCLDDDGVCSKAGADLRELLDEIENLPTVIEAEEGE